MLKTITIVWIMIISKFGLGQMKYEIMNSVWIKEGEICYDTLNFKSQNNFTEFFCDTGKTTHGKFILKNDTVTLTTFETPASVRRLFNKSIEQIPDTLDSIPISQYRYVILSPNEIQKIYFKDLISGYESKGTGYKYYKQTD